MKTTYSISLFLGLTLIVYSLTSLKEGSTFEISNWETPKVVYPADNPYSDASANLGSTLFFETLMSRDTSISCQSCHQLNEAFADHLPLGTGVDNKTVTRNTPTLFNIGFHPYMMKDGKFARLEDQALGPIKDHREFNMSPDKILERLKTVPIYDKLSKEAFGTPLTIEIIQKSLATFQRTLTAFNSPFYDFMRGDLKAISEEAKRGWKLFNDPKINCISCHKGYDFTDYSFQNNGLYKVFADSGRYLITHNKLDIGKFKIPTLRNVGITYPYMHNGSVKTLEEVLAHYAKGGIKSKNKSKNIKGFELSKESERDLIAFLNSLTSKKYLEKEE